MTQQEMEAKTRKWIEGKWKVLLLLLAAGFVVLPFILQAIMGLVGIVVGLSLAAVTVMYAPVFGTKMANKRLQLMKSEWAKNPIESLENDYIERQRALTAFQEGVVKVGGIARNMRDKVDEYKTRRTAKDAAKFETQVSDLERIYENRVRALEKATKALEVRKTQIERASDDWRLQKELAAASKAAGVANGDSFLQKLLSDTAFTTVNEALNSSFAELELEARRSDAILEGTDEPKLLEAAVVTADVIQLHPTKDKEQVR